METNEQGLELGFNDVILANKKQLKVIANNIVDKVKTGDLDSVEVFAMARKGTELFKELEESVRPYLEKDLKLTKGEAYQKNSVEFVQAETGIKYDYSVCEHARYNEIIAEIAKLNEEKKEIEAELKVMKSKRTEVDEDSGEVIEIYPPLRTSTDGFKVSLK